MSAWPNTRYSFLRRLGDPDGHDAWSEFQTAYVPALYRYARMRGLQLDDAADVVQEVMILVHQCAGDWKPSDRPGGFRAWLAETTRRIALRMIHLRTRAGVAVGGSGIGEAFDALECQPDELDNREERQRWTFFRAAAEVESEVQESTWRAFWLTAVEGRPAEAAARELGLNIGNVYSAKCRVLMRIRRRIESLSGDGE